MTEIKTTVKEYFKSLTLIHAALIIGLVFFIITTLATKLLSKVEASGDNTMYFVIGLLLACIGVGFGTIYFNGQLVKAKEFKDLKTKLQIYKKGLLVKFACLEVPCLLNIILYRTTGNNMYLYVTLIVLVLFVLSGATKIKLAKQLELSEREVKKLENPDMVVS